LGKFTYKDGNWRKDIERLEEDILKVAVSYSEQEEETERGKLRESGNGSKGLWRETEQ